MRALIILITILVFLSLTTSNKLGTWKINPNSKNRHIINFFKNQTAGPIYDFNNFKKVYFVMVDKLEDTSRKIYLQVNFKISDEFEQRNFVNQTEAKFYLKVFNEKQKCTQMEIDLNYQLYSVLIENSSKITIYCQGQQLIYAELDVITQDYIFRKTRLIIPISIILYLLSFIFMILQTESKSSKDKDKNKQKQIITINLIALALLEIIFINQTSRLESPNSDMLIIRAILLIGVCFGLIIFFIRNQFISGAIMILTMITVFTGIVDKYYILSILICLQIVNMLQLFFKQDEERQLWIYVESILSLFIHTSLFFIFDQNITNLLTISFLLTLVIIYSKATGGVYRLIRKTRWSINQLIQKTQLEPSEKRVRDPCFVCYRKIRYDEVASRIKMQCGHIFHSCCVEMTTSKDFICPIEGIRTKKGNNKPNKLD